MEENRKKVDVSEIRENYVYPVKVKEYEDNYLITLVDFPGGLTYTDNKEDIIEAAQELLALTIIDYIDKNKELPKPGENVEGALYVQVWMPYYRSRIKETYVRKSVTIPQWLDILARNNDINFSAALVRGVKEELGIK